MTLDISALRAKLTELKGFSARNDILWKPSEGENVIRIVPLKDNPSNPFTELYFHYLNNKTYLSPVSFGDPDPIAEFCDQLRAGGSLTKDEYRETKKFAPARRTYVPVIDRNRPQNGVRFWAFGKTVYSEILGVMADPEYGDITDPQLGRDIRVTFTPQEKSDTNFAKTSIRVSPKQSPLTTNPEELSTWLNEQPDLMSLYKRLSYDELKDILTKYIEGDSVASPTSRTVTNKSDDEWGDSTVVATSSTKKVASKKKEIDVGDDFDSLFKDA